MAFVLTEPSEIGMRLLRKSTSVNMKVKKNIILRNYKPITFEENEISREK